MRREWLVVEHENGRIEDLGFVDYHLFAGVGASRFQWRSREAARAGAALVDREDFDEAGLRRPLEVKMRDGGRQYWYLGEHAKSRMDAFRYNQRLRPTGGCVR